MRFPLLLGLLVGASSIVLLPERASAEPRRYYRHSPRYTYREPERYYRSYDPAHEGLFARFAMGLGGAAADDDSNDVTLSGGAGLFSLDLGGSLAQNLALHGRLSVNSMFEPSLSSGGRTFGDLTDTSLSFTLLGLGLTYYLPSNVYFTGVVGVSRASFEFFGDEYDVLTGGGVMGDIGYEWRLGSELGLGLAARLEMHSVRGDAERLSTGAFGLLLSVSYF